MHGDVAFCVTDDYPFLEEVKLKCADFIGCDVHVDFLYVAVERAPDLDLVTCGGEER